MDQEVDFFGPEAKKQQKNGKKRQKTDQRKKTFGKPKTNKKSLGASARTGVEISHLCDIRSERIVEQGEDENHEQG